MSEDKQKLKSFAATETYAVSIANRLFFFWDINTSLKEEAHEHQLSHQDTRLNGFLRIEGKGNI